MRIVLFQPNLFGDAIVTTPLLRQIRTALPQAHVTILLGPRNLGIRPLLGDMVDDVLKYAKRPLALAKLFIRARSPRYDYAIDLLLDPLKISRLLVPLIGARKTIGLNNGNGSLYTVTATDSKTLPVADRYLTLLGPLGVAPPADPRLELFLPDGARQWVRSHWPVALDRSTVLINIKGSGLDKFWGVENFVGWIRAIRAGHPEFQFVIAGHGQEDDVQEIAAQADIPPLPPTSQFAQFAACVSQADYVLSPDTSVIHLAAAFQKPVLGLYRVNPRDHNWTPYRSPYVLVKSSTERVGDIPLADGIDGFERLLKTATT